MKNGLMNSISDHGFALSVHLSHFLKGIRKFVERENLVDDGAKSALLDCIRDPIQTFGVRGKECRKVQTAFGNGLKVGGGGE